MGATTIEKGVLKLVHPGRHVEYHRKSITAGEIMRKNPRHSVTRPDFFKNPGIVVRPESVMVPGQVFYIVPNKTIHHLVKNKSQQLDQSSNSSHYKHVSEQTSPQKQLDQSSNSSHYKHVPKQTSLRKLWAGMTPMHQFHHEQNGSSSGADSQPQAEETTSDDGLTLSFQARDYYLNGNTSGSEAGITANYSQQENTKITRSHARNVHVCNNKQDKNLKSCLKKEGQIRVPNLRVTFNLTAMIQYRN